MAVARDSMINIHWMDVGSRHHGKEGNGASEDNDKLHECLSLRIRRELLREVWAPYPCASKFLAIIYGTASKLSIDMCSEQC